MKIAQIIVDFGFSKSLSEAKRGIKQGQLRLNDKKIEPQFYNAELVRCTDGVWLVTQELLIRMKDENVFIGGNNGTI